MRKFLVRMVLMITLIIITAAVLMVINKQANNQIENQECKNSIEAHIQSLRLSEGDYASKIQCPTIERTLTGDEEEIKRKIAQDMAYTWRLWKKGDVNIFTREETYCHVAEVIKFDTNKEKITGFNEYLATHKAPHSELMYTEFLANTRIDEMQEKLKNTDEKDKLEIDTEKDYAIIFFYDKSLSTKKELEKAFKKTVQTSVGGGTGAVVGGVAFGAAGAGLCGSVSFGTAAAFCGKAGFIIGSVAGAYVGGWIASHYTTDEPFYISSIRFMEYDTNTLKNMGCETLAVKQNN